MTKHNYSRTRASIVTGALLLTGAALTQGCLQRDVKKQDPNTSNTFVKENPNVAINEIDLLFVIDNSISMADKQEILNLAVPQMVRRLVDPLCKDPAGATVAKDPGGGCPAGSSQEFSPVDDIHIGVITSSLGSHGATASSCAPGSSGNKDDQGYLIPFKRAGLPDPLTTGFLAWIGGDDAAVDTLVNDFSAHVAAAGEIGCGFEATLESWYRFLIDPQPPVAIEVVAGKSRMTLDTAGNPLVDANVLAQREAFMRPEGLIAIVVLSDENDCSIMDGGEYYENAKIGYAAATNTYDMKVAAPICETNPNDRCCFSCLQFDSPPAGCAADFCPAGSETALAPELDVSNQRCFQQQRRFGLDLLYPTQRYVDALTKPEIVDARTGNMVNNPLLRGAGINAGKSRSPDLVFFAGIVGVPWQDLATPDSLTGPTSATTMKLLTATQLSAKDVEVGGATKVNRWEVILGQPNLPAASTDCKATPTPAGCGVAPVAPHDPFMIESIAPRTVPAGLANPVSGDLIVDYSSNNPGANAINGHEANHQYVTTATPPGPKNDDLQYACIFPLAETKTCVPDPAAVPPVTCANFDCVDGAERNSPLCQPPGGGPAENVQYFGKAYPGTRILQVLRDFAAISIGANSIVASICPKITTGDATDSNFGYNPAVQALVDRLAEKLKGTCLPREISVDEEGKVPCAVVETAPEEGEVRLDCNAAGREGTLDPKIEEAVRKQLETNGRCGEGTLKDCAKYQMCGLRELTEGAAREECLYTPGDGTNLTEAGFCYIDPAKQDEDGNYIAGGELIPGVNDIEGDNPLVKDCPASQRRLLRFVGQVKTPADNSILYVACTGDSAPQDAPITAPPEPVTGTGGGM